jgi:lysozyme family protein
MANLTTLRQTNAQRWAAAKLTREPEYTLPVKRILAAKGQYKAIEAATGVHWVFIACAHYRESSLDFSKSLAQGDDWSRVSIHVPKGRGPFKSFVDAAVDALTQCPPYAARNKDWSMPNMLTLMEQYNGLGYANRGRPSPYVWSGTDQYRSGKYVRDGVYDPNVVDKQLGVAGLIICLLKADPSIRFPDTGKPVETISAKEAPKVAQKAETPQKAPKAPEAGIGQKVWEWFKTH